MLEIQCLSTQFLMVLGLELDNLGLKANFAIYNCEFGKILTIYGSIISEIT